MDVCFVLHPILNLVPSAPSENENMLAFELSDAFP